MEMSGGKVIIRNYMSKLKTVRCNEETKDYIFRVKPERLIRTIFNILIKTLTHKSVNLLK